MHWIENALTNVNIEALNDILRWTIGIMNIFDLDIGVDPNKPSIFESTIDITGFMQPIAFLAMFIVICGVMLKLYIAILSPFDSAEAPAAILVRGAAAAAGVKAATSIFVLAEKGFNEIYKMFVAVYQGAVEQYTASIFGNDTAEVSETVGGAGKAQGTFVGGGLGNYKDLTASSTNAFNFFGGESLLNPNNPNNPATASLGILILELIIGCTLMICFFRLVLEVYERYVLLGVMYMTSPLAFASIISKDSAIFKNWFSMLISQFLIMCLNLVFIGGFIGAWYNIINKGLTNGYMFEDYPSYIATMFALVGWLVTGQKIDQHLKSTGWSVSQTGAGLLGAVAGGAVLARTALGAAGSVGGGLHRAANGQTMMQRGWEAGKEGRGGGIPGAVANAIYGGGPNTDTKPGGRAVGSVSSLPQDPSKAMDGAQKAAIHASNAATYNRIEDIAGSADVQNMAGSEIAQFSADSAQYVSGDAEHAVIESNGVQATLYSDFNAAKELHPGEIKPIDIGSGSNVQRGAIHFTPKKDMP